MLVAYLVTSEAAGTLVPGLPAIRSLWGRRTVLVLLMIVVLLVEYSPVGLLRTAGAGLGCR
jgi:hypothetical protein